MLRSTPRSARVGITAQFVTNGAVMSTLMPRLPEIKERFALSDFAFGLIVTSVAVGAMCAAPLAGPIVRAIGALRCAVLGTLVVGAAVAAAAWSPSVWLFVVPMLIAGAVDSVVDAGQNVHGLAVQRWADKSIIGSLHAGWSAGAAAGGAIGVWAAASGVPLGLHVLINSVIVCAVAILGALRARVPAEMEKPHAQESAPAHSGSTETGSAEISSAKNASATATSGRSRIPRPAVITLLLLSLLALSGTQIEDIANNWSTLYVGRDLAAPAAIAGLAFTLTLAAQFVSRVLSDPLTDRFGTDRVALAGGLSITLGSLLVVCAVHPAMGIIGFMLAGLGSGPLVPAAFAGADATPGIPHGTGVAIVGWLMRLGFLATSPLIGAISSASSLRIALLVPVLAGLVAVWITGRRVLAERRLIGLRLSAEAAE